jgi:hypothetical protein
MAVLPEPTWGTPTNSYGDPSSLCIIKPTPHVITGLILQLIRSQFSDPENIIEPKIRGYIWVDDDTEGHTIESKIDIIPQNQFNAENVQQRPSVVVARGPVHNKEFVISNGPSSGMDSFSGNYEGDVKHTLIEGTHNIECCGNQSLEADLVAEEIFFRMMEYKSVIKQDLNFSEFDVKVLNGLEEVDENHQHWKAVVVISWKFIYSWQVKPVAPVLKQIGQIFNIE